MAGIDPFSRRQFLSSCGAAIAGAALSPYTAPAEPTNRGVRFGVRSPLPDVTLRERALLVKRLGYDGIELGNEWSDHTLEALQEQLVGIDIAVSAMVGSIKLLDTDAQVRAQAIELDRKRLEVAQALGASGLIEVPTFGPNRF